MPIGQALLDTHMAALEVRGLELAARCAAIAALLKATPPARRGRGRPRRRPPGPDAARLACRSFARPVIGAATRLAPLAVPFDLEVFFRAHYTKVQLQTRQFLGGLAGHDTPALTQLLARLPDA